MGRLYVLCNNKLDPIYAAVQGGHAIAQYLIDQQEDTDNHKIRKSKWSNDTVVYLSVDIDKWHEILSNTRDQECFFSSWHEPDYGGKLTSIALHAPGGSAVLKKLKKEKLLDAHSLFTR